MPGFVRRYADAGSAAEARRRSDILAAAGVPTPRVLSEGRRHLTFERLEGVTGLALAEGDLAPLLAVVARMHRVPLPGLPVFDPCLRIRPRKDIPTRLPVHAIIAEPMPRGTATIHGDMHLGQFIRSGDGTVRIVDLDDLATGPPEADLANFAAHLATSLPSVGIGGWSDRICRAWSALGLPVDHAVFARFLRAALLRRHLKLREAGRPDCEAAILAYLRDSSNFSIL